MKYLGIHLNRRLNREKTYIYKTQATGTSIKKTILITRTEIPVKPNCKLHLQKLTQVNLDMRNPNLEHCCQFQYRNFT